MTAQHHPTRRPQNAGDEMLTLQEPCAFLRVPEGTLRYSRHLGSGPRRRVRLNEPLRIATYIPRREPGSASSSN